MKKKTEIIKAKDIQKTILILRNKRVMLDSDLAGIYGVTTSRLNEQIKRNIERFPEDFMFQLNTNEFENLKSQNAISRWGGRRTLPFAFTEHGAIMAASVLNSDIAVKTSIYVVRAFVQLREIASTHLAILKKIDNMEKKYDTRFHIIFKAIRGLLNPPKTKDKKNKVGFDIR